MPECNDCSWYKSSSGSRSRLAILRTLIRSTHGDVERELGRIEAEENGIRMAEEQEVRLKVARASNLLGHINGNFVTCEVPGGATDEQVARTVASFPVRFEGEPKCVDHCAQSAAAHIWYVPELRNWAGFCARHKPDCQKSICSRCANYTTAPGDADDNREILTLINALNETDSEAASLLLSRKSEVEQKIGPQKAAELAMAYNSDGRVGGPLRYLPFCAKRSGVPELVNRFCDCEEFEPRSQTVSGGVEHTTLNQGSRGARVLSPMPGGSAPAPVPNPFNLMPQMGQSPDASQSRKSLPAMPASCSAPTDTRTQLAAMGVSPFQPAPSRSCNADSGGIASAAQSVVGIIFGQIKEQIIPGGFPSSHLKVPSPAAAARVLASGDPPLTEEMLRRSSEVASCAFGRALSPEDRQRYADFTISAWNRGVRHAIDAQLQLIARYPQLQTGALDRGQAAALLQSFLNACGVLSGGRP